MAKSVFISHKEEDRVIAARICKILEQAGVTCWIAPRDIIPGKEWADSIVEALQGSRALVLLLSSACNKSPKQVCREIEIADRLGLPILTVRIEDVEPPPRLLYFLETVQWLNAFDDQLDTAAERLVTLVAQVDRERANGREKRDSETSSVALVARPAARPGGWHRSRLLMSLAASFAVCALLTGAFYVRNVRTRAAAQEQVQQGRKYFKAGDPGRALAAYNKAILLNKNCYMAYCARAVMLLDAGEEDRALADVETAIRINPKWPVAFRVKGDIHESLEEYRAAINDYTLAIAMNSADPRGVANIVQAYQGRADAHRHLKQVQLADRDTKAALRLSATSKTGPSQELVASN